MSDEHDLFVASAPDAQMVDGRFKHETVWMAGCRSCHWVGPNRRTVGLAEGDKIQHMIAKFVKELRDIAETMETANG